MRYLLIFLGKVLNGNMEGDQMEDEEPVYDVIDDSEDGTSKNSTKRAPVHRKISSASLAAKNTETGTESIISKLRRKFQRSSTLESSFHSPEARSSEGKLKSNRRRASTEIHGRAAASKETFPTTSQTRSSWIKSRSKTVSFGQSGSCKLQISKRDNMPMLDPEHTKNSCDVHEPNRSLLQELIAGGKDPAQNTPLHTKDDSVLPALPDRLSSPIPKPPRRRAKSLDEGLLEGKGVKNGKSCEGDPQDESREGKLSPSASKRGITDGKTGSLSANLENLSQCSWYWGPLTRAEADRKLDGKPDGSFLVRDSSHEFHLYSVSFRSKGRTLHSRIKYDKGRFGFATKSGLFQSSSSVVSFVNATMKIGPFYSSPSDFFWPSYPVHFLFPVSRFEEFPSLKHLCRIAIRCNSRSDKLHELPLPPKLRRYLKVENPYLPEAELNFMYRYV